MICALLLATLTAQVDSSSLYPCPRIDVGFSVLGPDLEVSGVTDFNLDGVPDPYARTTAVISDGDFGASSIVSFPLHSARPPAAGDLNGDGYPDLVATRIFGTKLQAHLFDPESDDFSTVSWSGVQLASPYDVATGDVDGDGHVDVVCASSSGGSHAVFLGDGAGDYTAEVPGVFLFAPETIRLGDLNSDGRADLAATGEATGVYVALAIGGGAFGPAVELLPGVHLDTLALADLDGDGDLDLAAAGGSAIHVLPGHGTGGFGGGVELQASAPFVYGVVQVIDYDGSGTADVTVCDRSRLVVASGDGAGGFEVAEELALNSPGASAVADSALADFDADGDVDLVIGGKGDFEGELVFYRREGAELERPAYLSPAVPLDFDLGDVDGDGDDDLVNLSGALVVGTNDGAGGLTFGAGIGFGFSFVPEGVRVTDLAGDGVPDLVVFSGPTDEVKTLTADGQGGFLPALTGPFAGDFPRVALGDWISDGRPDLCTSVNPGVNDDNRFFLHPGQARPLFGPATVYELDVSKLGGLHEVVQVTPADMNVDGELDLLALITASGPDSLRTLLGDGAGAFAELQATPIDFIPAAANDEFAAGDFDADGLPDVMAAGGTWLRGTGGGLLALAGEVEVPKGSTDGLHSADLNGDGADDVFTDHGAVMLGGPGGPTDASSYYSLSANGMRVSDLDGDGGLDLVARVSSAGQVLLRNRLGCGGSLLPYGVGCSGTFGAPQLAGAGCPAPGATVTLAVSGAPPRAPAVATFGLGAGSVPLPNGCELLLAPWTPVLVSLPLDAGGAGELVLELAADVPPGAVVTSQVAVLDAGAVGAFVLTNGLRIELD